MHQQKISSGIAALDELIEGFYIGDNVIWEAETGSSPEAFVRRFLCRAVSDRRHIIYVSFNHSPQSISQKFPSALGERFTLLDCFTSGKGKDDRAFAKFYTSETPPNIIRLERPTDISAFAHKLNELEDSLTPGACYVFDSLTGMQDLWGGEQDTYQFFTYMCPRLYDLQTVAYWLLEKEAHSPAFKANLHHITQVVLELNRKKDKLYIKALKLDGRQSREAFKPRPYCIEGTEGITIHPEKPEHPFGLNIGPRIRELRTAAGLNQKELADRVELAPSSISQIESNQTSPSLNSFLLICNALGASPSSFWKEDAGRPEWLIPRGLGAAEGTRRLFDLDKASGAVITLKPDEIVQGHPGKPLAAGRSAFAYLLSGGMSVSMDGRSEVLLPGDAVIFSASERPIWKNRGSGPAELLVFTF